MTYMKKMIYCTSDTLKYAGLLKMRDCSNTELKI